MIFFRQWFGGKSHRSSELSSQSLGLSSAPQGFSKSQPEGHPSSRLEILELESMVLLSGSCHGPVDAVVVDTVPTEDYLNHHDVAEACDAPADCGHGLTSSCTPDDDPLISAREHAFHQACQQFIGRTVPKVSGSSCSPITVPSSCSSDVAAPEPCAPAEPLPVSCDCQAPEIAPSCPSDPAPHPGDPDHPIVDDYDSILDWNAVMLQANANDHGLQKPEQGGPILSSRAFAIVSAAMYDAYNSIEHIGQAYLTSISDVASANSDAAVAQAAYDTLLDLFPSQKAFLDAELAESLTRIADGESEDLGRQVGSQVAHKIIADREVDGYDKLAGEGYVPNRQIGFHDVDPLNPTQGFYGSGASNIDGFVVDSADQFQLEPLDDGTPAGRAEFLKSDKYLAAYQEVKALGGDGIITPTSRTEEQTLIGKYWAYDGRPEIGTPPRLYNQIVRQIALQEGNTEAENARLFALVNVSMADAGLTSWNTKYDDAFWRPILGIRSGEIDGNPDTVGDANWTALGAPASNPRAGEVNFTPNFPAYTSGHATFGAAAFQSLTRFYGRDDISFSFVSDELNGSTLDRDGTVRPLIVRSFDSFSEASHENAQSRIYLGIHWSFDAEDGIEEGNNVANYVFENAFQTTAMT